MSAAADLARLEALPERSRPRPTGDAVVIPFRRRPDPHSDDEGGDWSVTRLVRTTGGTTVAPFTRTHSALSHSGRSASGVRDVAATVHTVARPLRLTRRGVVVCVVACVLVSAAMLLLAHQTLAGRPASFTPTRPATVVVEPGDTLWSIARAIAPDRDPRAEVRVLRDVNDLPGTALVPGQVLRTS